MNMERNSHNGVVTRGLVDEFNSSATFPELDLLSLYHFDFPKAPFSSSARNVANGPMSPSTLARSNAAM